MEKEGQKNFVKFHDDSEENFSEMNILERDIKSYQNWNHQDLINWLENYNKISLRDNTKKTIVRLGISGKNIEQLTSDDYLLNTLQICNGSHRQLIQQNIGQMIEQNKLKQVRSSQHFNQLRGKQQSNDSNNKPPQQRRTDINNSIISENIMRQNTKYAANNNLSSKINTLENIIVQINEQLKVISVKNSQNSIVTHTFYCYFKQFQDNDKLFIRFKKIQQFANQIYQEESYLCEMIRIPNHKIFFFQIPLQRQKVFQYQYTLERIEDGQLKQSMFGSNNISRSSEELDNISYVIFDTPKHFNKSRENSTLQCLRKYIYLYIENITAIQPLFFQCLHTFIKQVTNPNQEILPFEISQNQRKKLPMFNQILYSGILQKYSLNGYQDNYDISFEKIKEKNNYSQLSEWLKDCFIVGLVIGTRQSQMIDALTLPNEILTQLPHQFWNFNFNNEPPQHKVQQINFQNLNQSIRNKYFESICQCNDMPHSSIFNQIPIIKPSIDSLIKSINNLIKSRGQLINKDVLEFYLKQENKEVQKYLLYDSRIRKLILVGEKAIRLSLNLFIKSNTIQFEINQSPFNLRIEDIYQIILDLLSESQSQAKHLVLTFFMDIIKLIDNIDFSVNLLQRVSSLFYENLPNKVLNKFKEIVKGERQQYYELILTTHFQLKNEILIQSIIEIIEETAKYMKLTIEQSLLQFVKISNSRFVQQINISLKERVIINVFEIFQNKSAQHFKTQNSIKMIENQSFVDMLSILKIHNLTNKCKSSNDLLNHLKNLINDFNNSSIKLSNLRILLDLNSKCIQQFIETYGLKVDLKALKNAKDQIDKQGQQLQELKIFAKYMDSSNMKDSQELNQYISYIDHEDITFFEYNKKMENPPIFDCSSILFKLNNIRFAKNFIQNTLMMHCQNQNLPQNAQDFNNFIKNLFSSLRQHLQQLLTYDEQNDNIPLIEMFQFWGFIQNEEEENQYDETATFQQINQAFMALFENSCQFLQDKNKKIIQHVTCYQLYLKEIDLIQEFYLLLQLLGFGQIGKYREGFQKCGQLIQNLTTLRVSQNNVQLSFNRFMKQGWQTIQEMNTFFPKQSKQQIKVLVNDLKSIKDLIQYQNELDKQKICLEDLIDVIDDTSMETDVLIQQIIGVRNTIQDLRSGGENCVDLFSCLIQRYKKYNSNKQSINDFENILQNCNNNLAEIKLKINDQQDCSAKSFEIIQNLQQNIQVKIDLDKSSNTSVVTFITQQSQSNKEQLQTLCQIINQEELNIHINRYNIINSKKIGINKNIEVELGNDTSTQLLEVLDSSEEIRLITDNLRNLGHQQFSSNYETNKKKLDEIILELQQHLQSFKSIEEIYIKELQKARETYLSLNFFPPYTFYLIEMLIKQKDFNESQLILKELYSITKYVNELKEPNIEGFKQFLKIEADKKLLKGLQLYGPALDILLELPKVKMFYFNNNDNHNFENLTNGQQIEYRRIKSPDLLFKSIMTTFLSHNQLPTSWQIFFCSPQTQIHDLIQYAQLAKNIYSRKQYEESKPLFLICSFEFLSIQLQRQFVDDLEKMYTNSQTINLLILYEGNSENSNQMHIIQQFKNAFEVDCNPNNNLIIQQQYQECFKTISLHKSKYSGFGKTFQINKRAAQAQQQLIEIPLYGETTREELIDLISMRIKQLKNSQQRQYRVHLILFDLKTDNIHCILFQLLVLKRLSSSSMKFVQIPSSTIIEIEVQNTFLDVLEQKIKYLKEYLLPNNITEYGLNTIDIIQNQQQSIKVNGVNVDQFEIDNNPNISYCDLQVAFQYLKNIERIQMFEVPEFEDQQKRLVINYQQNQISQQEVIQLIKSYFLSQIKDNFSYYHLTSILKFFTKQSMLFHKAVYLKISQLEFQQIDKNFRRDVFLGIINTAIPKSCQIMSNNYSDKHNSLLEIDYFMALEKRNKNIQGWDTNFNQNHDFFLTISQSGSLIPIFQNISSIPQYYNNYCTQTKDPIVDWNNMNSIQIRNNVLINLCATARDGIKLKAEFPEELKEIAITKTIARKICFLFIKIYSDIPTLIMGETGVGKTILVKYLSKLIGGVVLTLNIHAGVTQREIIDWINYLIFLNSQDNKQLEQILLDLSIKKKQDPENEKLKTQEEKIKIFLKINQEKEIKSQDFNDSKIILFFDEINTNQNIDGILKELLIDRKIQGMPLPKNFIPIAAANPYKFKTAKDQAENTDSLKITGCENTQISKLIYHVYPFAEAINTFIWDFGELQSEDELEIVKQMIQNSIPMNLLSSRFNSILFQTIVVCQQFSRNNQSIRSVSLRDVQRFLKVFQHFLTYPVWKKDKYNSLYLSVFYTYYCRFNSLEMRQNLCQVLEQKVTVPQKDSSNSQNKSIQVSVLRNQQQKNLSLGNEFQINQQQSNQQQRISQDKNQQNRDQQQSQLISPQAKKIQFTKLVRDVVNKEMEKIEDIINVGESYKAIAFTTTLKDNLFMTLVSLLNNIPIITVGPPGSSKTLCTRLLYYSMKGNSSKIEFFKKLPNLMYKTFQCSFLSTSESIEKVFNSAKRLANNMKRNSSNTKDHHQRNIVALLLDEIGLAEASKTNPLKVLHRLLEDQSNVPMIGLSNWSLDASKMNRVVFANRPSLSENELIEAAIAIQKRISQRINQNILINLAKDSYNYFSKDKQKTYFHGSRDFYNCVTQVCYELQKNIDNQSQEFIKQTLLVGILRNFGGKKENKDVLEYFKLSLTQNIIDLNINKYNPTELITMNIKDRNCRNLMIISSQPEQALKYTERLCQDKCYKIFQGSQLYDNFSEQNSYKMLNEIITCMEEGYLIIMYSLEILYQSFYDLFNQNYVELGASKYCRVAIGSDSIRSRVHQDFKVIIIAESKEVFESGQYYDPPLLNRFEKQFLDLKFVLNENEISISKQIVRFIDETATLSSDVLKLQNKQQWAFTVQDMYPMLLDKQDMVFSLTLKHNKINNESERIQRSILELIDLSTFSGIVRSNFLKKLDDRYYKYYLNSSYHFQFNALLSLLSNNFKKKLNQIDQSMEEAHINQNEHQNSINEQNIIIYTPQFNNEYPKEEVKSYVEIQLDWVNAMTLQQDVKNFFSKKEFINLILIANASDQIAKIIHAKRILEEERLIFEKQQNGLSCQKNLIIVIQLVNQNSKFSGLSFDQSWKQVYLESVPTPQTYQDEITNYLLPIQDLLLNENDQIYQMILSECLPKILQNLNYDGEKLTEQNLKDRLRTYNRFLSNQCIKSQLNLFIKQQIITRIIAECEVYQTLFGSCSWYQLISLQDQENRVNNKFISSLKKYLIQQSFSVLIKIFHTTEQNNVISSLMSDQIDMTDNKLMNTILGLLKSEVVKSSNQETNCDQSFIKYPFFRLVQESVEKHKQYIMNDVQKIEERNKNNRNLTYNHNDENRNNRDEQQLKLIDKQDIIEIDVVALNEQLFSLTQFNDPLIKQISQFNPKLYFDNLSFDLTYQWTKNKICKRIIQKMSDSLFEKSSVESYHLLIWLNENILASLSQVWDLAYNYSQNESEKTYQKFEIKLEICLKDLKKVKQEKQRQHQFNYEDYQSKLEKVQQEILVFTSYICEVFVLPQQNVKEQMQSQDNWISLLQNCLEIIFSFSTVSDTKPDEMLKYLRIYHFILRIYQYFSQNKDCFKLLIQQIMYDQRREFQVISCQNYLQIKDNLIKKCDPNKQDELTLRLIRQLFKSDNLVENFLEFNENVLESILKSIQVNLKNINFSNIQNDTEQSHIFISSKRVLEEIITMMYEKFIEDMDENQDVLEELLEPMFNPNFKKMKKVFQNLQIQPDDPICTMILDIIGEQKFYNSSRILNYIAMEEQNQENIEINEFRVKRIIRMLTEKEYDIEKGVFINIIELKILQEICLTSCTFVYENYQFNQRNDYVQDIQQKIRTNFEKDRIRKNKMIQILNQSLSQIIKKDEKNPLVPSIVVKIFKKCFKINNLKILANVIDVFNSEIFHEQKNQQDECKNLITNLKSLKGKQAKELLTNQHLGDEETKLLLSLINHITELILDNNQNELSSTLQMLDQQQPKIGDPQLIIEINKMYSQMSKKINNQSYSLKKIFVFNLISSSFLDNDTFIKKLYYQKVSIEQLYLPFMIDSDSIFVVKGLLKNDKAIRRFQCKNCVKLKYKNPYIWHLTPCCLPQNQTVCVVCKKSPLIGDHQSPDMEPPLLSTKQQEPIFVNKLGDKPTSYFYGQPKFPYTGDVQTIDDFIKNRSKVDPGYQHFFSLINNSQMRQLSSPEEILFGRVFMLSILSFYFHLYLKSYGKQQNEQDIISVIKFIDPKNILSQDQEEENDIAFAWKRLQQKYSNNETNVLNYFVHKIVKNILQQQSGFKLDMSQDQNRIQLEKLFVQSILESKNLSNLAHIAQQIQQKEAENENIKEVILNNRLNLIQGRFELLKNFNNIIRIQFIDQTSNQFLNFQNDVIMQKGGLESEFLKINFEYKQQTYLYSQIYSIQNWVKVFNILNFDKITSVEAAETNITQYIEKFSLHREFEVFRAGWQFFRKQIQSQLISIAVDCAKIELDDIDNPNQKIDIFCYSEDKNSRGYPLYLLLIYFKDQHNSYLEKVYEKFCTLFHNNNFPKKKFILMNKKNFFSPNISFHTPESQERFFEEYVKGYSGKNLLSQYEEDNIYDLKELTCEFIEENFEGLTKIDEPDITDLERIQLKNFRYKGDYKDVNLIQEISIKIKQILYPDIQNNKQQPFRNIDLINNEICMKFLDILKLAMSIIIKINSNQTSLNKDVFLIEFLKGFNIQYQGINFEMEKIKICHLQHVYELAERKCFDIFLKNVHGDFLIALTKNQKQILQIFCREVSLQDLEIFHDAIGRIIIRVLSDRNVQLNRSLELFFLFTELSEEFESFWGIENLSYFNRQVHQLKWNDKYDIFRSSNQNTIILGQAYELYKEIQAFQINREEEEIKKNKKVLNAQQADQQRIDQEFSQKCQFNSSHTQIKKNIKQKKGFK